MEQKLSPRRGAIVKIVVGDYISQAVPVASESIVRNHQLGISSATIRNELARLEEEDYLARPHTSAGAIPTDKGYRYYVESLANELELSIAEQRLIHHLFHQVEKEVEEWVKLTASLVARLLQNVAVVTPPKAAQCRLRHLELVALQEFMALLVIILREARLKQQLLSFDEATSQEKLSTIVNIMNTRYRGLTSSEIQTRKSSLSPKEEQVTDVLLGMMQAEDDLEYEEPYLEGLHSMLNQLESTGHRSMLDIVGLVEERGLHKAILSQGLGQGVRVFIGKENREEALKDFSVVVTGYGVPGQYQGAIGVVGPRRMQYGRVISTVRYLSYVLSGLTSGLYIEDKSNVKDLGED